MKKMDALYLLASIAVLSFVFRDRLLPGSIVRKTLDQSGIQLVLITTENDCIDCLEKSICSFETVSKILTTNRHPISNVVLFANTDGTGFNTTEFDVLCRPPEHIIPCSFDQLYQDLRASASTPAFLLVKDGRILDQEPVFVPTDFNNLALRFSETLANLEAMYPASSN